MTLDTQTQINLGSSQLREKMKDKLAEQGRQKEK